MYIKCQIKNGVYSQRVLEFMLFCHLTGDPKLNEAKQNDINPNKHPCVNNLTLPIL